MSRCVNPIATEFLLKLNSERGWNLIGGHRSKEFSIPSGWFGGRYYFDGFDKERLIFFEYNEPRHHEPERKARDAHKKQRLTEVLQNENLKGIFVVYDEKTNTLTEEIIVSTTHDPKGSGLERI